MKQPVIVVRKQQHITFVQADPQRWHNIPRRSDAAAAFNFSRSGDLRRAGANLIV
jgi:hypothetical protein